MHVFTIAERWLSGRRRRSRKPLTGYFPFGGSNPPLSASFVLKLRLFDVLFHKIKSYLFNILWSLCLFDFKYPRIYARKELNDRISWDESGTSANGTGFRFISAFTDRLVLCAPSDFFKSVFQFSSIFCSVLAQTVDEPIFYHKIVCLLAIFAESTFFKSNLNFV